MYFQNRHTLFSKHKNMLKKVNERKKTRVGLDLDKKVLLNTSEDFQTELDFWTIF